MISPQKSSKSKHSKHLPWVEKYRPSKIKDVSYQDEVTHVLETSIKSGNLPHLLFYGKPGTGKTTTILAAAHELFGSLKKDRVLELNASDERGIDVVRNKIKNFARYAVGSKIVNGKKIPSFKLIVLDEADSMTPDAQAALRRTMETYSKVTRFCLICNYVSRIIEPLASRCAKFRFKPLPKEPMMDRLHDICQQENIKTSDKSLLAVIDVSGGDMRQAVNLLQNANSIFKDEVTADNIIEISGVVPASVIADIWKAVRSKSFMAIEKIVKDVMCYGYNTSFLIETLLKEIISMKEVKDVQKAKICLEIANADKCLSDGADEYLQLLSVVSVMGKNIDINAFSS